MQQAPGYHYVSKAVAAPIMPTPLAFGHIISELSMREKVNIIAMDIGGATTDIFSVLRGEFNRTVSANLGMSYSIANVVQQCGLAAIKQWLPFEIDDDILEDIIGNKMLFPTSLPSNEMELMIEQAVAREALRLSIKHHSDLIRELPKQKEKGLKQLLKSQYSTSTNKWDETASLVNMKQIGLIIGSGGVLSHAPLRTQAALMLLDSCRPEGVTRIAVDSVFMMPHLGVLAQKYPEIALQVLWDDCFIPLGTVVSGVGDIPVGQSAVSVRGIVADENIQVEVQSGGVKCIPAAAMVDGEITITPAPGIDVGNGAGRSITTQINGGAAGLIIDMRFCNTQTITPEIIHDWFVATGAYSELAITRARRQANELN